MIITPSERRRAEEFEALLEGRSVASDADLPLLDLSTRLRGMDAGVEIDSAFRDRLRTRLLAVASVQGVADETPRRTRSETHRPAQPVRRTPRRLALVAGTVTALAALTGVGAASTGAVPGDALYNVKRSREAAQLALARSDESRGQLHFDFARTRLAEAVSITGDDDALSQALDDMDADTRSGMRDLAGAAAQRKDAAPLDAVDDFVAAQRRQLVVLISGQPRERRARALDSLKLLDQIRDRSNALRSTIECGSLLGARTVDELGVLPRRCGALPQRPGPDEQVPARRRSGTGPAAKPSQPAGKELPSGRTDSGTNPSDPTGMLPGLPLSTPSGGADGVLDTVTGTVGGVVGGLAVPPAIPQLP